MLFFLTKNIEIKERNSVKMNSTLQVKQNQTIKPEKLGIFSEYFTKLNVGSILNRSGIVKTKGASPLEIFTIIFNLAFIGKNFYEGVVRNKHIEIGKDAVYNFLNTPNYNWRRFAMGLFAKIYFIIIKLLDNSSEEVLILDDSPYERNRSKKVELLSKVYDHSKQIYIRGFRMLTLGWSDGNTFLGIDFALLSSTKQKNRYSEINSEIDKRTCGYSRRKEAITKSTALVEAMIKRAINIGVRARYIVPERKRRFWT